MLRLKKILRSWLLKNLGDNFVDKHRKLPIQERSGIRRADRFLSNKRFYLEKIFIHRVLAEKVIGNRKAVDILVDWTGVPKRVCK
jgi:hypothetical protein